MKGGKARAGVWPTFVVEARLLKISLNICPNLQLNPGNYRQIPFKSCSVAPKLRQVACGLGECILQIMMDE